MNHTIASPTSSAPAPAARGSLARMRRPERPLLYYYLMQSLLAGPGFLFLAPFRFFRYRTLRYIFDDEGLTMRWGILFRREITLTYARIQDIHLVSNIVERWLGLGRVQIQTASGSASAEITIEGLPDFEELRDELYMRMRGTRGDAGRTGGGSPGSAMQSRPAASSTHDADVVAALADAASELRALREELSRGRAR